MPVKMVTIMKTVWTVVPTALWKASSPRQAGVLQCSAVFSSEVTLPRSCVISGARGRNGKPKVALQEIVPHPSLCVVSFLRSFFSKAERLVFLTFPLESLAVSPPQLCAVRKSWGVRFCSPCSPFYNALPLPSPVSKIPVTFPSPQVHPLPVGIICNFPSC